MSNRPLIIVFGSIFLLLLLFLAASFLMSNAGIYAAIYTTKKATLTCGDNQSRGNFGEQDFNASTCVANGLQWGLTYGNASGSCWKQKCCGDDNGEYSLFCYVDGSVASIPQAINQNGKCASVGYSCVNTINTCAYNNIVAAVGQAVRLFKAGHDRVAYCRQGRWGSKHHWSDCDQGAAFGVSECSSFGKWLKAGESGVGEKIGTTDWYASGAYQFCGDDANESVVSVFCPGASGESKCCNNLSDKIDRNGRCVSECQTSVLFDADKF